MDVSVLTENVIACSGFAERITTQIKRAVVGQEKMVRSLLIGLLADGHILLEGVPGLAKTRCVRALAQSLGVDFGRVQFTPDLLPADVTGTLIYNPKTGEFYPRKGPVFANILLADEINRAPAKVQAALLEAMQEHQVTIGDTTYSLPSPFLVMATQNPIEQEGTYPLPEAQTDRFMMKVVLDYPTKADETKIIDMVAGRVDAEIEPVATEKDILNARSIVNSIYVDDKVKSYIVELVFATREPAMHGLKQLEGLIELGASPRASLFLTQASRANAFLQGRGFVTPQDVKSVGLDVMRHRIKLSYEAEAESLTADSLMRSVFDTIEVP